MSAETTGDKTFGLNALLSEVGAMKTRLTELERIANEAATERERSGCHDDELLAECLDLLERATWHDGRYGQQTCAQFQAQAQKLVPRIAARLRKNAYAGFKD